MGRIIAGLGAIVGTHSMTLLDFFFFPFPFPDLEEEEDDDEEESLSDFFFPAFPPLFDFLPALPFFFPALPPLLLLGSMHMTVSALDDFLAFPLELLLLPLSVALIVVVAADDLLLLLLLPLRGAHTRVTKKYRSNTLSCFVAFTCSCR